MMTRTPQDIRDCCRRSAGSVSTPHPMNIRPKEKLIAVNAKIASTRASPCAGVHIGGFRKS
eukprot:510847-Amphidinium_carterae.2